MRFSKIKIVAIAAMFSLVPVSGTLYAAETPPNYKDRVKSNDATGSVHYFFKNLLGKKNGLSATIAKNGKSVTAKDRVIKQSFKFTPYLTKEGSSNRYDVNWVDVEYNPQMPPKPVPIDGGASLLLVAGAAYGIKRFRKNTSV